MSGVFLSYSRPNRDLAFQVITALRALGVDVWWDEDMPGVDWQEELERQINTLAAVIVLWTPDSIGSKNVRDEARLSQHTEKLVNVLAGVTAPPFPFDRVNGLPLDGWNGRDKSNGWTRLIRTLEDHLVTSGAAEPGALTTALEAREKTIRTRQQAIATAQAAHQTAQSEDEASTEAARAATSALEEAQEQLRRVAEMRGSLVLMRAAQTDLDATVAAKDDAEQARKAAGAALSKTARALTRAKAAFEALFDEAPVVVPSPMDEEDIDPVPPIPVPEPEPEPEPIPVPEPIPPPPKPVPPEPAPIPAPIPKPEPVLPKSMTLAGVIGRAVITICVLGAIAGVAMDIIHVVTRPKVEPGMLSPDVAAGGAAAMADIASRIGGQPTVAQTGAVLQNAEDLKAMIDVQAAERAGNYAQVQTIAMPLATKGNAEAQFDIGMLYFNGQGTAKDPVQAKQWLQTAANQGYAHAETALGMLYGSGQGVGRDDGQAAVWFQKAAAQGDSNAQYNLGVMYEAGNGVPRNAGQARAWYAKAAVNGSTDAQDWLNKHAL